MIKLAFGMVSSQWFSTVTVIIPVLNTYWTTNTYWKVDHTVVNGVWTDEICQRNRNTLQLRYKKQHKMIQAFRI